MASPPLPSGGLAYNCGMPRLIAAIDAGTTSTRCILFDRAGRAVAAAQKEHRQITPRSGWLEHDPQELWTNTAAVIAEAMARADASAGDVAAVGLTNQRETTLLWERATGRPVHNAIVWSDARTADGTGRTDPRRPRTSPAARNTSSAPWRPSRP